MLRLIIDILSKIEELLQEKRNPIEDIKNHKRERENTILILLNNLVCFLI